MSRQKETLETSKRGPFTRLARGRVMALLKRLERGHLTIEDGSKRFTFGRTSDDLEATIRVLDPNFYLNIAFRGSIGAGESFMNGQWLADDLTRAIQIIARNKQLLKTIDSGFGSLFSPIYKAYHTLKKNTPRGSRKNIAYHYDLGNDFFRQFLDETMMYSSAVFASPEATLFEASTAKLEKICQKLKVRPQDHLLEIGTGWGGLAIHAARNYGCTVTTTTISQQQFDYVRERIAEEGLNKKIHLIKEDYRNLTGRYDKLASIEMIEAVGYEFLETYFQKCDQLLRPGGIMVLQAITIAEEFLDEARRSVDFIKRFIFPGSALPSLSGIQNIVSDSTSLEIVDLDDLTTDYAITLRRWRERFFANLGRIQALGVSEEFIRMWHFYFCYCEAGFLERHIGDYQATLIRDSNR